MTVAQLREAGLGKNAITSRVRAGRLHRVGHGVYAVGHIALSREARWLAAVFTAGLGAALSRVAAGQHLEVWRYRDSIIDVVVPARRRPKTDARIHRCANLDPRDVTVFRGIPVTTVARLLVDLSDEHTKWELANVIHEAEFRDRFSLSATRDMIARANGRHHLDRLEAALQLHEAGSAGARSRGELRVLAALEARGLPEPLVNTHLCGHEVDFHWPEHQLAVELDGSGHNRRRTRNEDADKEAAWRAGGFEVLRFKDEWAATDAVAAHLA